MFPMQLNPYYNRMTLLFVQTQAVLIKVSKVVFNFEATAWLTFRIILVIMPPLTYTGEQNATETKPLVSYVSMSVLQY